MRPASASVPSTTSFSTLQSHDRNDASSDPKNVPVPNDYRRATRCDLVTVSRIIRLYNVEQEQVQLNDQKNDSNHENCIDDSSGDDVDQSNTQMSNNQHHHRRRNSEVTNNNNNNNSHDDNDYDNDNKRRDSKSKKKMIQLKMTGKDVPVIGESTCCYTPRQSECRSFYTAHARLHCWVLAQRKTLLIRAELPDSFPVIEVEAEVSVRDLALARGLAVDALLVDPELGRIAREIIDQAELTVEDKELSRLGYAKANDALDASYLKQKNGQVVSIVVHMRKWGQSAKKHHSTSEAFIDAITEGMQTTEGNVTPKISR